MRLSQEEDFHGRDHPYDSKHGRNLKSAAQHAAVKLEAEVWVGVTVGQGAVVAGVPEDLARHKDKEVSS